MLKRLDTIGLRLTLWYMLLLALALLLFSGLLYVLLAQALYQRVDDGLRVAAQRALSEIDAEDGQLALNGADGGGTTPNEPDVFLRLVDDSGQIATNTGPFPDLPVSDIANAVLTTGHDAFATVQTLRDATPVRLYSVPYVENNVVRGVLQVGQSLSGVVDTLRQLSFILMLAIPATLLAASAGGLFLARRALSPVDQITRAAQRINADNLNRRLDLALPDDELGRLARTFDAMLERLDNAFRRQRQFTADASHELRTPLTIMKGDIGVALTRRRDEAGYRRVLSDIDEEVDRLTRLVEDLLILARADTTAPGLHTEPVDVADLLSVAVDQVRPLAGEKAIILALQADGPARMNGDADKLLRVFLNLLDNAIKYTPPGGQITVQTSITEGVPKAVRRAHGESAKAVLVQISDTGPGIPREHLDRIFERFYRADDSRSRGSGGAGLGLAIAQVLVQAHRGVIEVRSEPEQGSTFSVWLPLSEGGTP